MITIIPAIDIIEGKSVRLSRGDFSTQKIYYEDPLDVAKMFADAGLRRLHLVDLDGARDKQVANWKILERIAAHTDLIIDFGGGVQSDDDLRIVFEGGASMATAGSIAVKNQEKVQAWLQQYGGEKIILGADVHGRKIAIHSWQETSDIELIDFLNDYHEKGARQVICTDVSKDGMLAGPNFELYREIKNKQSEYYLIASGGVGKIEDVERLNDDGIDAVIIGKAFYEGRIQLADLKGFIC
jgi:phosphoribosylformimino-5-aminoimidazole carboxamide ribotide isomerase